MTEQQSVDRRLADSRGKSISAPAAVINSRTFQGSRIQRAQDIGAVCQPSACLTNSSAGLPSGTGSWNNVPSFMLSQEVSCLLALPVAKQMSIAVDSTLQRCISASAGFLLSLLPSTSRRHCACFCTYACKASDLMQLSPQLVCWMTAF